MSNTKTETPPISCEERAELLAAAEAALATFIQNQQLRISQQNAMAVKRDELDDSMREIMENLSKKMQDSRSGIIGNMRDMPAEANAASALSLTGLSLKDALAALTNERFKPVDEQLQRQFDEIQKENQQVAELNDEIARLKALPCGNDTQSGNNAPALALVPDNSAWLIYGDLAGNALFGSDAAETIYGGTGLHNPEDDADVILAGAGDDVIYGNGGDDILFGEAGNDTIHGGLGNDVIFGEAGNDMLLGSYGHDFIVGGAGNDTIYDGYNTDFIGGGDGNDLIFGGNDTEDSLDAGDLIFGGAGNDTIYGNGGADSLLGDDGHDLIDGGIDDDLLIGGNGNDTLIGNSGNDLLVGGRGVDHYYGGGGADLFVFGLDDIPARGTPLEVDVIHDFEVGIDKLNFELTRNIQSVLSYINNQMTIMDGINMFYEGTESVFTQFSALKWMGSATFSGLSGVYTRNTHEGTLVQVEATGDGILDYAILLKGVSAISASDIML